MANGRNKGRKGDSGRDSGGFIALPWSVLDSPAYGHLSHPSRSLLLEVARQFVKDNNGRLLLSRAYMATRGWKSTDMITKCKNELLEAVFIFQTVQGHRPNKASWYAVTWRALDRHPGYDVGAEKCFERGAYRNNALLKNAGLRPPRGTEASAITPPHGTEQVPSVPPHGPVETVLPVLSVPPHGHHLEMPSTAPQPSLQTQPWLINPQSDATNETVVTAQNLTECEVTSAFGANPPNTEATSVPTAVTTAGQQHERVGGTAGPNATRERETAGCIQEHANPEITSADKAPSAHPVVTAPPFDTGHPSSSTTAAKIKGVGLEAASHAGSHQAAPYPSSSTCDRDQYPNDDAEPAEPPPSNRSALADTFAVAGHERVQTARTLH